MRGVRGGTLLRGHRPGLHAITILLFEHAQHSLAKATQFGEGKLLLFSGRGLSNFVNKRCPPGFANKRYSKKGNKLLSALLTTNLW